MYRDLPSPDYFDKIEVTPHEDDFSMWKVVGVRADNNAIKTVDLQTYISNKPLAEAFVRWYTDNYWIEQFSGAQDC